MYFSGLDTTTRAPRRSTPATTTERVASAWTNARHVTRRSLVAAVATSIAIGATLAAPLAARLATGTVGTLLAFAALVDVHERKLPNQLLAAAAMLAVAGRVVTLDPGAVARTAMGLLGGGALLLIVRVARGIGMGDVKMAAVVGASVGATSMVATPVAIAVGAMTGATHGLLAHRSQMAFGPALWLGWAVALTMATGGVLQ